MKGRRKETEMVEWRAVRSAEVSQKEEGENKVLREACSAGRTKGGMDEVMKGLM